MLEKSLGLLFFLKKPSPYRKGPWLIFLRITVDGIPKELSLKRTWEKGRWMSNPGHAAGTKEDAKALNFYLDIIRIKAYEARTKLIEKNEPITAQGIKDVLSGAAQRKRMFLKIFEAYNNNMKALIGIDYSKDSWEKYDRVYNFTKEFLELKYGMGDINILSLNMEFIKEYYNWYRTVRKCSHNTSIKYISMFKTIVLQCVDNGWLLRDPFTKFDMSLNEVDTVFLTKEELETIARKEIRNERLSVTRDIFIFCCLTSLAYIDVKQLKQSEVTIGVDGKLWIDKKRQKTKVPTSIPLLPLTKQILDKYKNDPRCNQVDKLLPVHSNSKYNEYLKEIAAICGINKNLTTHAARHTFGTTVSISNGVPLETVKKIMGHKRIEQTEHYAKVLPIKVSADIEKLKKKLKKDKFLIGYSEELLQNNSN